MAAQVWTQEMRKVMYARLLQEFGPHSRLKGSRRPTDKKKQFEKALAELSALFSQQAGRTIMPDAVENQIDWGIPIQKEMRDQSHARNFILNKAAALEVGFITSAGLPEYMNVRQK